MERLTQDQEREDRERIALLDSRFQAESIDTHWASDISDLLTRVLASEELGQTDVLGMDSRTSLCWLNVTHANAEASSQFELLFSTQMAEALPQVTYSHHRLADGRINTVLYLARHGYDLPQ